MSKGKIGFFILGSAIIWGAVILGTGFILKGTPYKDEVIRTIAAGSGFHLILIWGPLSSMSILKKKDKGKSE